jgi:hypothetical protein
MILGFTGSRQGPTDQQKGLLELWLAFHPVTALYHGAAIGADEYVAERLSVYEGPMIYAFPCNIDDQISRKAIAVSDSVAESKPPLKRNRDIVDGCDLLMAMPGSMTEELRSGTWATIRYARKVRRSLIIIWPDGTTREERVGKLKKARGQ